MAKEPLVSLNSITNFIKGYIYEAFDKHLGKDVALKVEKKDKNKTILLFEYNVLLNLKGKIRKLSNIFN